MNQFEEFDKLLDELREHLETIATLRRNKAALRTRLLDVVGMLRAECLTKEDRERLAKQLEASLNREDLDA